MNFLPENIATYGTQIDGLAALISWLGLTSFVLAEAALIYAAFRYRRSEKRKRAAYIKGESWGQAKWIFIPLILVVLLDIFIDIKTTAVWKQVKIDLPTADMNVRIVGQQFNWQFTHPGKDGKLGTEDDVKTTNELHVPVDTNVVFELGAKDVLHSFFVPALRLTQDAVPGRFIHGWFNATKPGKYEIACGQICGTGHTGMRGMLIVHNKEEFQKWVENPVTGGSTDPMEILKSNGCTSCHSVDGTRVVGPSYKGIWGKSETVITDGAERQVVVDEAYIKKSIREPKADTVKGYPAGVMPAGTLSDADIDVLIKYFKTLK